MPSRGSIRTPVDHFEILYNYNYVKYIHDISQQQKYVTVEAHACSLTLANSTDT